MDNEFDEIKCRYIDCYAGMGVAGMLRCFLGGDYRNPNCKKYVNEKEELKKQEKAAQNCD
jgi:hypothetical protein